MKEKIYYEAKVRKSKTPIEETIKKLNIVYPNSSLGFLHAIYAKVDGKSPNLNGVILAKSVKKDVPKLRFTQANRNHEREAGPVLGTILDAWVNEKTNEIEIVFSFFKSLFPEHWEEAQQAIEDGELTVSFELSVDNKDVEIVNGKYRKLKRVDFDGVGLLFPGITPAYKNAKVLKFASDIINDVFDQNQKQLVCAKAQDTIGVLEKISQLIEKAIKDNTIKGEIKMDKKANDALLAKQKEIVLAEFGEEAVKDWSDEDYLNQDKIDALRASLKDAEEKPAEAKEEKSVEASKDEASESDKDKSSEEKVVKEEKAEEEKKEETAEKTVTEVEEKVKQKVTYDDEKQEEKIETESETVVKRDGEVKVVEKNKKEVTYTYAQMEEVKAEYEEKIQAKDKEIEFLKENAKKVVEIRSELGDFVKDLSDEDLLNEDKLEKARLQKRVDELETASEEKPEEKKEEKPEEKLKDDDLQTGHTEKEQVEEETSDQRVTDYLKDKYGK